MHLVHICENDHKTAATQTFNAISEQIISRPSYTHVSETKNMCHQYQGRPLPCNKKQYIVFTSTARLQHQKKATHQFLLFISLTFSNSSSELCVCMYPVCRRRYQKNIGNYFIYYIITHFYALYCICVTYGDVQVQIHKLYRYYLCLNNEQLKCFH